MKLSQMIGAIESELAFEYLPGAIKWCDEHCDNAWSDALDRFDHVLSAAIEGGKTDVAFVTAEGAVYKFTVITLLQKYKARANMDETDAFLSSLRKR